MHWPLLQRPLPPQTQQLQSGSEQPVLSGLLLVVHPPEPLHVELFWHDPGVHVYVVPLQMPALHTSVCVQFCPSLQGLFAGLFVIVQAPLPAQTDDAWHWLAVQV